MIFKINKKFIFFFFIKSFLILSNYFKKNPNQLERNGFIYMAPDFEIT
jgi:hypothetical protein